VFLPINAEKDDGPELSKRFSIVGYPTYVVLNGDGATVDRWIGYEKKTWLASAEAVLADPVTVDERHARFAKHPSAADAARLAMVRDSRGEYAEAVTLYRDAQRLNEDPEKDYLMNIFMANFYGARKKKIAPEEVTAAADAILASPKAKPGELADLAYLMVMTARGADRPEQAIPYLKAAVDRTEGTTDPDVQNSRADILPDYALLVLKDAAKATAYKKATLPEGWMTDPGRLNGYAWWCFENGINLDEAQTMAEKGAELAKPGKERAMILDTLAEICNARGNPAEALAAARRALADAPDGKSYQEQVERFGKLAGEKGEGK
jgi:tetratricopeptide (TPR) repeat protein